jgi:hypothetical protein
MGASTKVGWYGGKLEQMAEDVSDGVGNLGDAAGEAHWTGRAAENFREASRVRQADFRDLADKLGAAKKAISALAAYTG